MCKNSVWCRWSSAPAISDFTKIFCVKRLGSYDFANWRIQLVAVHPSWPGCIAKTRFSNRNSARRFDSGTKGRLRLTAFWQAVKNITSRESGHLSVEPVQFHIVYGPSGALWATRCLVQPKSELYRRILVHACQSMSVWARMFFIFNACSLQSWVRPGMARNNALKGHLMARKCDD